LQLRAPAGDKGVEQLELAGLECLRSPARVVEHREVVVRAGHVWEAVSATRQFPRRRRQALRPFMAFGSPLIAQVGPMPYPVMNRPPRLSLGSLLVRASMAAAARFTWRLLLEQRPRLRGGETTVTAWPLTGPARRATPATETTETEADRLAPRGTPTRFAVGSAPSGFGRSTTSDGADNGRYPCLWQSAEAPPSIPRSCRSARMQSA
jgi:hypothetical protein